MQVDTEAETDGDWVPVIYNGTTGYVSSDYVTLSLATGEGVTIEEEREEQERIAAEEAAKKASQVTEVTTVQNSAATASTDEVTLLAAIIQCEAGNEIYEGQVAVGAVVMNRVRSGSYPSSIYEVIYQSGQFPPAEMFCCKNRGKRTEGQPACRLHRKRSVGQTTQRCHVF